MGDAAAPAKLHNSLHYVHFAMSAANTSGVEAGIKMFPQDKKMKTAEEVCLFGR